MTRDRQNLRYRLVSVALEWQRLFRVAPQITGALAEYDAARLVRKADRKSAIEYGHSAVTRGHDFIFNRLRYQVKGSRPSSTSKRAFVTKVAKPNNYDWDVLIWILYDPSYEMLEAWQWKVRDFKQEFKLKEHIRPPDLRRGLQIFPIAP
jgi:hypothetical protein